MAGMLVLSIIVLYFCATLSLLVPLKKLKQIK